MPLVVIIVDVGQNGNRVFGDVKRRVAERQNERERIRHAAFKIVVICVAKRKLGSVPVGKSEAEVNAAAIQSHTARIDVVFVVCFKRDLYAV